MPWKCLRPRYPKCLGNACDPNNRPSGGCYPNLGREDRGLQQLAKGMNSDVFSQSVVIPSGLDGPSGRKRMNKGRFGTPWPFGKPHKLRRIFGGIDHSFFLVFCKPTVLSKMDCKPTVFWQTHGFFRKYNLKKIFGPVGAKRKFPNFSPL